LFGKAKTTKAPRGDGTGVIASTVAFRCLQWSITLVHLFNGIHMLMLGLIG